ncbi:MAG: sulfatase [Blastocatellia bacterium]
MAAWFGLLTGLAEVAVKAVQKFGFGQIINAGADVAWMAPLAGLIFFLISGLALVVLSWIGVRFRARFDARRLAAFTLTFLGLLNLLLLIPRLQHYAVALLAGGGAVQISRLISARAKSFRQLTRRTVGWLAAWMVIAGIVAQGGQWMKMAKLPPAPPQAPNVLLIVLDTVRAHNLSLYGYERATTPNLEQLASRSVVFERALSTAPWTLPSHAGMFTGRFAHELSTNWNTPLDAAHPTLAEQFSGQGYLTAGFVANTGYCSAEQGLDRGFIHYEDYRVSRGQLASSLTLIRVIADNFRLRRFFNNDEHLNRQSADVVSGKFLRWLSAQRGRPFFVFLNYYDAHEPYLPPAPFDRKFGPGRRQGKHSPLHHLNWNPAFGRRALTSPELQEEVDAYDGAISYLDQQLGRLFVELKERGVYDNTVIIITSDHGEEFGEHGVYDHGNSLYLPSVHVPLLISFPARAPGGRRVAEPVTLRDLPATMVELTGLQARFPGQSLARYWAGFESSRGETEGLALSSVRQVTGQPEWFPVSKGDMHSLVYEGRRYIRNGDGGEELYDFEKDPWERRNLAGHNDSRPLLDRFRILLGQSLKAEPIAGRQLSENGLRH